MWCGVFVMVRIDGSGVGLISGYGGGDECDVVSDVCGCCCVNNSCSGNSSAN